MNNYVKYFVMGTEGEHAKATERLAVRSVGQAHLPRPLCHGGGRGVESRCQ